MKFIAILIFLMMFSSLSNAQNYNLKAYVIDDGGISRKQSGGYRMGGSVGQSFAGRLGSSNYTLYIGYWTPAIPFSGIEEIDNISNLRKPMKYSLKQNAPNPIFSRTVIEYSIPKSSIVAINVYDAVGREVAKLLNKKQSAGFYKVTWDIGGVSRGRLPNGVYFYRLKAGDYSKTRKMVIVR